MLWRMVKSAAIAGAATLAVQMLPDLARYLRIRNPQPRTAEDGNGVRNA